MLIWDKKEYERFKENLTYEPEGTEGDPGPYWHTSYLWNLDKSQLVNNLPAVKGVMEATKRKLQRNPAWEVIYEQQLRDLIIAGYSQEVPEDKISE